MSLVNHQSKAYTLERKMVPHTTWDKCGAPEDIVKYANESAAAGIPCGIAHDDQLGWCVIEGGQGPYIARCENYPDDD